MRLNVVCTALLLVSAAACGPKPVEVDPNKDVKPVQVDPVMSKSAEEWFLEGVNLLDAVPADYTGASERFANALVRDASFFEAYVNLGFCNEKLARFDEALAHYGKAAELKPEDIALKLSVARVNIALERYEDALTVARSVLSLDSVNTGAYYLMALAFFRSGDLPQAERMAKEVLTYDAENVPALNLLGVLYQQQNKDALASYVLDRALNADPKNAEVLNNLGLLALKKVDIGKAVLRFASAIEANPQYLDPRLNLGVIFLDYLDYAAALEQFTVAYELAPQNAVAHLGFASSLFGSGELEKAAEAFESYGAAYPDQEVAASRLAPLYERQLENPAKACEWYTKWSKFRPDDANLIATRDFLCSSAPKE